MWFAYTKKSSFSFFETLDELSIAFWEEGFWLVSNIDVSEKIRKKGIENFWEYRILGFCKPEIAYKYLSEDMDLGVFLPCSVIVYEKEDDVYISTWLPEDIIWKLVSNPNLEDLDRDISNTIRKIIDSV